MLGHVIVIALSREQLIQVTTKSMYMPGHDNVSRLLILGTNYDLVFTDYMGLQGLHDTGLMGIFKCHIRLLDSFGTEAICKYLNMTLKMYGNIY